MIFRDKINLSQSHFISCRMLHDDDEYDENVACFLCAINLSLCVRLIILEEEKDNFNVLRRGGFRT